MTTDEVSDGQPLVEAEGERTETGRPSSETDKDENAEDKIGELLTAAAAKEGHEEEATVEDFKQASNISGDDKPEENDKPDLDMEDNGVDEGERDSHATVDATDAAVAAAAAAAATLLSSEESTGPGEGRAKSLSSPRRKSKALLETRSHSSYKVFMEDTKFKGLGDMTPLAFGARFEFINGKLHCPDCFGRVISWRGAVEHLTSQIHKKNKALTPEEREAMKVRDAERVAKHGSQDDSMDDIGDGSAPEKEFKDRKPPTWRREDATRTETSYNNFFKKTKFKGLGNKTPEEFGAHITFIAGKIYCDDCDGKPLTWKGAVEHLVSKRHTMNAAAVAGQMVDGELPGANKRAKVTKSKESFEAFMDRKQSRLGNKSPREYGAKLFWKDGKIHCGDCDGKELTWRGAIEHLVSQTHLWHVEGKARGRLKPLCTPVPTGTDAAEARDDSGEDKLEAPTEDGEGDKFLDVDQADRKRKSMTLPGRERANSKRSKETRSEDKYKAFMKTRFKQLGYRTPEDIGADIEFRDGKMYCLDCEKQMTWRGAVEHLVSAKHAKNAKSLKGSKVTTVGAYQSNLTIYQEITKLADHCEEAREHVAAALEDLLKTTREIAKVPEEEEEEEKADAMEVTDADADDGNKESEKEAEKDHEIQLEGPTEEMEDPVAMATAEASV